jgi:hypothetical protein
MKTNSVPFSHSVRLSLEAAAVKPVTYSSPSTPTMAIDQAIGTPSRISANITTTAM